MKNINVSKFENFWSNTPIQNVSLIEWLGDESLKVKIENIRSIKDKALRNKLKASLPCITPSGIFSERKVDCLVQHSGYICVDIDAKDNPHILDFVDCRNELAKIKNILYAGLSVSGNGVFAIIPLSYPEKHADHFRALEMCFKELGITIDKSCKDVSRLRGASYDTDAYINLNAEVFTNFFDYRHNVEKALAMNPYKDNKNLQSEDFTRRKVLQIISRINSSSIDITENYEQWFQIGCALANEFGEEGREMFQLVSANHPKYYVEAVDRKFTECLNCKYAYSIGTFFYWAEQYSLK